MEIPTIDDFNRLETKVTLLTDLLEVVLQTKGTEPVCAKDIAVREGISYKAIYNSDNRHYLPNFGVSEYPEGKVRWKLETYLKWSSMPITERKSMWINMSAIDRQEVTLRKKPALIA